MEHAQKVEAVKVLHQMFQDNELVVVTQYSSQANGGLTMKELDVLRSDMRPEGATFKIIKNRLAKRALQGTRYEALADMLKGPVAVAVSKDPVAAAKVTYNFAKTNSKIEIIGGALGDTLLDAKGVEALAKLPSLDEVRGKLVALIQTPATRIATIAQAPASQLARVTKAYAEKE